MKKLFKTSFILLALLGVMFTSCKKEYEIPPIPVLPVGEVYTIGDLLAMPANTSFDTASVYGIVTADEQSGNLYKTIFIQDRRTGKAIELLMNTSSAARVGDSVRVFLDKNIMVNNYHNLPQLVGKDGKGFNPDGHLIIYPYNKVIEPTTVTIADIKTGNYTAGLVRLENVEFVEQGSAFCNVGENTNRTLKDATGELLVRTSNYANFAYDLLPNGKGTLVAIASVYNNDWQLIIRSKNEMQFEGGEPTPPAPPGQVQHLPYFQSFGSDFGTYTTYDAMGDQSWVIDYSTAKMTGYVNSTYYANEDWLISSPVELSGVDGVTMTMSYIGRYFTNINDEVTIWVSTDYTYGNDPATATWDQVPARLSEGSNWTDFLTVDVDLTNYVGQTITVAVKYTSTEQKAGTMEIQSISIAEAGVTPPGPGGDVQSLPYFQSFETEFGTYTTFDVLGAESWMIDFKTAKMTGYVSNSYYANEDWLISSPVAITGVNDAKMTMEYIGRYFSNINNEVTIWGSTDYTFGSDPTTVNWTPIPATLTEGSNWNDFLTAEISLTEFVGQTVTIAVKYTSTNNKAGTMEIKSITIEEGSGVTPTPPPGPGGEVQNMPYVQSFASEFGTYTTYDVLGPESWMIDYQTAKMTGYVSQNESHANEDWLISSPVAITGVNDAKMTMVYIARYFDDLNGDITIWASSDYVYGSDPTTATWTHVPAMLLGSNSWSDFVTTDIALTDYVGQTVTLAVKYVSRNSRDSYAGTIEIQSITIQEGSGVGPTPPPTPGTPEGTGTGEDPYNVAAGIVNQGQENVWVHGYIVGAVKNGTSTVSSNNDVIWSGTFDSPTNVVIADDPTCNEITLCVIVNLPAGKPLRSQVNLVDNPTNLGKMLTVRGKLRTYFGQAGLRDSNGTENDFFLEGYVPPTPPQSIFSESFAYGQGDFVIEDVLLPGELNYVWAHSSDYSCMKASAYVGQAYETESWLVSPYIDLTGINVAELHFEQAVNYAQPQGALSVMITTEYVDTVDGIEWEELQLSDWPAGNNWTFISSTANLAPYVGQRVTIAFKYTSTPNGAATWEVKNFVVE
jgi:hypothetical protein